MNKRTFLKQLGTMALGSSIFYQNIGKWIDEKSHLSPTELAQDEAFWKQIRAGYRLKDDYINLENGYYCMLPQETLEKYVSHLREMNFQASYYMRTVQWENKKNAQKRLAELAGVSEEELIITRNTTESLDMIISGFPWEKGDEAIMAEQDYGAMLNQFKLIERRFGVVNKRISVPLHPQSDEEIVKRYEQAITPKTRLLMVCHMINITGHILPIRKICDMAHSHGVEVMVDGAHTFAQIEFKIPELGCDYFGASLHKWLSSPLGAGILYVKKEKIPQIWPLLAEWDKEDDDILKLNHTGTHPCHTDLAIGDALDYYFTLGPARKEARLRYLQRYWTNQVRDWEHIVLNTPQEPQRSCAIANVGVKGVKPKVLAETLLEKYRIWTVAIDGAGVHGCRITPNIFTSTQELDTFVAALKDLG